MDTVHLYAQYSNHDEAVIVANKVGLIRLRDAINDALESGNSGVGTFTSDGEGYHLLVICQEHFDDVRMPYTADYAQYPGKPVESLAGYTDAYQKCKYLPEPPKGTA
jgi:hypothetical protein